MISCLLIQGVPEKIAQSLSTTILQPCTIELCRFQQNVYTTKASDWIMQLNILYYSAGNWSIWKQNSQLADNITFYFHICICAIVLELEGVSTVKIFSSKNQVLVWLILLWVIRFFKRLHAFNRFSLSAAVRDWTSRRRNTLIYSWQFSQLKNVKFLSLLWSPVDSYSCPWLSFLAAN